MTDLSTFPVTGLFPPAHPDRLQLYSVPTPNGVKVSIMLEETGVAYEPHFVDFAADRQHAPGFEAISPNGKIPAILDPDGPGGRPLALAESGAILLYLAEKTGRLLDPDPAARLETLSWVFFQVGHVGPMFGQLGFFTRFGGKDWEDKRPRDRFAAEARRLLDVLELRLAGREWMAGDAFSIADVALIGWLRAPTQFPELGQLVDFDRHAAVSAWLDRCVARPAVQRGLTIPSKPEAG